MSNKSKSVSMAVDNMENLTEMKIDDGGVLDQGTGVGGGIDEFASAVRVLDAAASKLDGLIKNDNINDDAKKQIQHTYFEVKIVSTGIMNGLTARMNDTNLSEGDKALCEGVINDAKKNLADITKRVEEKLGKTLYSNIIEQDFNLKQALYDIEQKENDMREMMTAIGTQDGVDFTRVDGRMYPDHSFVLRFETTIVQWYSCFSQVLSHLLHHIMEEEENGNYEKADRMCSMYDEHFETREGILMTVVETYSRLEKGFALNEYWLQDEHELISYYPQTTKRLFHLHKCATTEVGEGVIYFNEDDNLVIEREHEAEVVRVLRTTPVYYNTTLISLIQTLKAFGFKEVKSGGRVTQLSTGKSSQRLVVTHPLFKKGRPLDIRMMRKNVKTNTKEGSNNATCAIDECNDIVAAPQKIGQKNTKIFTHCPYHIGRDELVQNYPQADIVRAKEDICKLKEKSKENVAELSREREKRAKNHRSCKNVLEEDKDFVKLWAETTTVVGWEYEELNTLAEKASDGVRLGNLIPNDSLKRYMELSKGTDLAQTIMHKSLMSRCNSCADCFLPVPGKDENGKVLDEDINANAWYGHHLDHPPEVPMSDPRYLLPSDIPRRSLRLDDKEGETAEECGRFWHYKLLVLRCRGCHEEGTNRKRWKVDPDAVRKISDIYYHPPDEEWISLPPLEKMKRIIESDEWKAWKQACIQYDLERQSGVATISMEELESLVFNILGYRLQDLVTWADDAKNWEILYGDIQKCKNWMKMVALAYAKKKYGVCTGRKGMTCYQRDIRNCVPARLSLYGGDHGERDGSKKYDPASLVGKGWDEIERELCVLKNGFICAMCDGGKY